VIDALSADSETPESASELSMSDASEAGVESVCLCARNAQPLSDSSPIRPVNESRTSLAIGFLGPVGSENDGLMSLSTARNGTGLPAVAHFSQIVLCIWRL
jgi:hypothetical protein